jgi:hypothetical protein
MLENIQGVIVMKLDILMPILAQVIEEPDILGDIQNSFANFVETGQIWALLIGFFIGYFFKGMTSY